MSLAIDIDEVESVLLADGWHDVQDNSFTMDAYEFICRAENDRDYHQGGHSGISATGFAFTENLTLEGRPDIIIAGPLSAILAVRYRR